jgi:spartin
MLSAPEAFQLLTLPNATISNATTIQTGTLALECVTIAVPPRHSGRPDQRDVYLVLKLNTYETPLDPTRVVEFSVDRNGVRSYRFLGTETDPSVLILSITPTTNDQHILEDLETFEGILIQYASEVRGRTHPAQPATTSKDDSALGDLRGHLVLINEDNGEVVGQVDQKFHIREDPRLHEKGRENEPVVIEVPEDDSAYDEGTPLEVFARYVPPEEGDWMTKGATVVRRVHISLLYSQG